MMNIQEVGEQKLCQQLNKKYFVNINKYCVSQCKGTVSCRSKLVDVLFHVRYLVL